MVNILGVYIPEHLFEYFCFKLFAPKKSNNKNLIFYQFMIVTSGNKLIIKFIILLWKFTSMTFNGSRFGWDDPLSLDT